MMDKTSQGKQSKRTVWIEQAQSRYGPLNLMGAYVCKMPNFIEMIQTAYEDPQIRKMARTIREECGDERLIRLKNVALNSICPLSAPLTVTVRF